jgi:hypothetical protein
MSKKRSLYNTTEGKDLDYTTDSYKEGRETGGNNPTTNPYIFSTTIGNPKKGIVSTTGTGDYSILDKDWDRHAEGFAGETPEELLKYRSDTQSNLSKGVNTVVGGILSGIGTFMEDVGYIADLDTYRSIFTDIDVKASKNFLENPSVASFLGQLGRGLKSFTDTSLPAYERTGESDSVMDQVISFGAFKSMIDSMVGFGLTGAGAGKLVGLASKEILSGLAKVGKWGEAALEVNKLKKIPSIVSKLQNATNKLARIDTWGQALAETNPGLIKTLGSSATSIFTKMSEARMEGLGAYEETLNNLQPLILDGTLSQEEAEDQANIAGNHAIDMTKWTMAGDALMLRGLWGGKKISVDKVSKPGFRTSLLNVGKHLLGAPKEGLEEMWQEAAVMEGNYDIYQSIKDRLSKDQQLSYIKRIGFNPEELASGFSTRTAAFLDSNRAQVAGWIGALSGPLQSAFLHYADPDRKERQKQEKEGYSQQQSLFKDNETLFKTVGNFTDVVKNVTLQESMHDIAVMAGDDVMYDIATETAFMNIAAKNFIHGTVDQLEQVLNENDGIETSKLKPILEDMKKDYRKSKSFVNPETVFAQKRAIKIQEKLNKHYLDKSIDPELSEKERKAYLTEANKVQQKVKEMQGEYNKITSTKHQLDLVDTQNKMSELTKVYSSLEQTTSITQLDNLLKKYPDDPFIKEKRDLLKKQGEEKMTSSPINKQTTTKVTEVVKDTLPIGETYVYNGLPYKLNRINKSKDGMITSVSVTDKEGKEQLIENKLANKKNFINRFTKFKQETTSTNIPIIEDSNLHDEMKEYLSYGLNEISKAKGIPINIENLNEEDIQTLMGVYKENIGKVTDEKGVVPFLAAEIGKIYNHYIKTTTDVMDEPVTTNDVTPQQEQLAEELFNSLGEELILPDIKGTIDEDFVLPKSGLQQRQEQINNLFAFIQSTLDKGVNVEENFTLLIKELLKTKQGIEKTRLFYPQLRRLFLAIYPNVNENTIPQTFDELLGIEKPDYSKVDDNMPTLEKNKAILKVLENKIQPDSDLVQTLGIYTNENVVSLDNKNTFPATSFAYRSQQWEWEVEEYNEKNLKLKRTTSNKTVDGNPVLNPNKFNMGDDIQFQLNETYAGNNMLTTGEEVPWLSIKKAGESTESWEAFQKQHKLQPDEEWIDYYPISIGTELDGPVANVHDVSWINSLTTIESDVILDNNKNIVRQFKKDLIKLLKGNNNTPIKGKVAGKYLEISNEGYLRGAVLNTDVRNLTADSLPSPDLKFGLSDRGGIKVQGYASIPTNTLNKAFLPDFGSGTIFVFTPLGKVEGEMKYWAHPIMSNKLTTLQTKTIRQAIEIFVTQNEEVNKELYDAYLTGIDNIDLKKQQDLTRLLKKVIYLYDSTGKQTVEEFVKENGEKGLSIIEFSGDTLKIGRSIVDVLKKGQPIDSKTFDRVEIVLNNTLFNVTKSWTNLDEPFSFIGINEQNKLEEYKGTYNEFIKQNTTTLANSTKLNDDEYSYTIQNIVRFDMNSIKELQKPSIALEQPIEERQKEYSTIAEAITSNKEAVKALEDLGWTIKQAETFITTKSKTIEDLISIAKAKRKIKHIDEDYNLCKK